ncbi:SLBB domain-containing protein [Eubacteriales bacterium OttesenSCG-928-M02]|nr:SLBB domain-containing protein [Eubacteriales bacterium OttesenSCG-928-M02]
MQKRERVILIAIAVVLLSIGGRTLFQALQKEKAPSPASQTQQDGADKVPFWEGTGDMPETDILITLLGEVENPGSFRAQKGFTLEALIAMRGGLTPEADVSELNLSQEVQEDTALYIPPK